MVRLLSLSALLALTACSNPAKPLLELEADQVWTVPELEADGHIVFTDAGVPHIYAKNRRDLAVLWGYQIARDRYFMMDLSRRLALGELSEVLGDAALSADMESRSEGNRQISERMLELLEAHHPDIIEMIDGYAEGVNAYVAAVRAGDLPPPSEYALAGSTLEAEQPVDLMTDFDRLDVVAGAATVLANSGFEGGDVRRGLTYDQLDSWYDGFTRKELRQAAVYDDLWDRVEPSWDVKSAAEWDPAAHPRDGVGERQRAPSGERLAVPVRAAERILARRARWDALRGHDWEHGWGSNVWGVSGSGSADGRSLMAGDGHLALTIPPLFYQIGLNTELLSKGKDDLNFMGMAVAGVPVPGPGTNGHTAWGQIAFFGDVTDWYREEVRLDASGRPEAARFGDDWVPLVEVQEQVSIRDIPTLGSEGRELSWSRWTTADGKWIADIEGRGAQDGEDFVWMGGDRVVPEDLDGDGVITAIAFDYAPLDGSAAIVGLWGMAEAKTVGEFHEATKDLNGNAAGLIATDKDGGVLYTGFQAVPCRTYLPRNADGSFIDGADPSMLLDGTRYGGFNIPLVDGHTDLSQRDDPQNCVVPFEDYPWSQDPGQQFLVAANNDPGGQSFDVDLTNDGWYVGGPWLEGYRAHTIERELTRLIAEDAATIETMQELQANHDSRLGEQFLPVMLEAVDLAEQLSQDDGPKEPHEARMVELWNANSGRISEARTRLTEWQDRGFQAKSGVETVYDVVEEGDEDDSVATMIFNAWYPRFMQGILDDERIPSGAFQPTGDSGRQRLMIRIVLEGRGADNPAGLTSFDPETGESVYFDDDRTAEIERSDELMVRALVEALDFLESRPASDGVGGFGTDDMDRWKWGLRHHVRFDSILAEFLGDDPAFSALTGPFAVDPERVPIAEGMAPNDDRFGLPGFPRHGDHLNVDAANPGTSGTRFSYNAGPVFRMVVALGPDSVEGYNILPGGQSGLNDSPYFDDQAQLWLGNEALPMHYTVDEVMGAAQRREAFVRK